MEDVLILKAPLSTGQGAFFYRRFPNKNQGIQVTRNDLPEIVNSAFSEIYNPVEEYLNSLPKWNGRTQINFLKYDEHTN